MKKVLLFTFLLIASVLQAAPIKHRFLVMDEPGHQLVHVDENNPAANWKLPIAEKRAWDLQLIGNDQLTVCFPGGYHVVDINSGQVVETVPLPGLGELWSIRRLPNGKCIVIGMEDKETVYAAELDADLHVVRKSMVPKVKQMRFGRVTTEGNGVAAPGSELMEWDLNGTLLKRVHLPKEKESKNGMKAFMALKDDEENYWVACGYGAVTLKLDSEGQLIQRFAGPDCVHFTSGFQRLMNGNLVQANWGGHTVASAVDGPQLIEFNPMGEVVWVYHDPEYFGCPVSVIILDDLDTSMPAGDHTSILKNF